MPHLINPGIAFCTPMPMVAGPAGPRLAPITVEWHRARRNLGVPTNIGILEVCVDGKEVGEARSECVRLILDSPRVPSHLFFLDYDVIPQHDALCKLFYRAKTWPSHDIFCGVYTIKSEVGEPLIYKSWFDGPYWDWSIGDIISEGVVGCHMGLTMIRTELLARMHDGENGDDLFKTVREQTYSNGSILNDSGSEDLYFCKLAREKYGAEILVDTGVLAGHQDIGTGRVYGLPSDSPPAKRATWMDKPKRQKQAIDLGAGGTRRDWAGYKTFTTDIRADTKPDYVMDSRKLTLPDDRFDLVASSHHLEHVGRWDQEDVWKEMYRICKPGGAIEHVVPSVDWAATKMVNGNVDEHVMNVLYGAQESHGYARDYNTHYFGYTKEIAVALAQQAGFTKVEVKDWRDDSSLGYNLVITGVKPHGRVRENSKRDVHHKRPAVDQSELPHDHARRAGSNGQLQSRNGRAKKRKRSVRVRRLVPSNGRLQAVGKRYDRSNGHLR